MLTIRDQEVLNNADALAEQISAQVHWQPATPGSFGHGYWAAKQASDVFNLAAAATAGLDLLTRYAGAESTWTQRAMAIYDSKGMNQSDAAGAEGVSSILRQWISQVNAGVADIAGDRSWDDARAGALSLMDQVRHLLEDRAAHPAASIVLCGAALEIALRGVIASHQIAVEPHGGLNEQATALRHADLISVQDVKDLAVCGGLRNQAAHGEFDELSSERAGLMEQHTSLLLRRLADIQAT